MGFFKELFIIATVATLATGCKIKGNLTPKALNFRLNGTCVGLAFDTTVPSVIVDNSNKTAYPVSGYCYSYGASDVTVSVGAINTTMTCNSCEFSGTLNLTTMGEGPQSMVASQTPSSGGAYTATVTVTKDTLPPNNSTAMAWTQVSPGPASVTAAWTKSNSADLGNQQIQFYSDGTCTTPSGSLIDLGSATIQTRAFTGTNGTTYTYKITSIDLRGNSQTSGCSSSMLIDTIPPTAPTGLGWTTGSPSNATGVTASWTKSVSTDLANQKIQFYSDAICSVASGSLIDLSSAALQTRAFTGTNATTYTYRITSIDNVGNSGVSACSSAMTIDTTPPTIAIITPTAGSYINIASDSATYTVSGTCSENAQTVTIKSDGSSVGTATCVGGVFSSSNVDTTSLTASSHSLTAVIADLATNSTTSGAVSVTRDVTAPNASTALGWSQTSPAQASVTSAWTKSNSSDLGNQKIQYYTGTCTTATGSLINLSSNSVQTDSFSGSNATTYSYKITSFDNAGNSTVSACSSAILIDTVAPSVTLTSPNGGNTFQGSSSQNITWAASDVNLGATPVTIEVSSNGGTSFSAVAGPIANTGTYSWTLPAGNASTYKIRITVVDGAGNSGTATSASNFTIDSTAPVFTASAMNLNGGAGTAVNNYLTVNLQVADALTNITHFCLKYNDTSTPTASATCWTAVNAPSPGLTPATSLNLVNYNYGVGFVPATYNVYVWAKDAVGNISTLSNAGAGTASNDTASIVYAPGTPPVLSDILAVSSDSPSNPQTGGDLTAASGSSLYIKWKATDDTAIPAAAISLYYTTDDTNYTLIASGLSNGANGSCSVNNAGTTADDNDTGCYLWNNGSPVNTYYKIRVAITDSGGMIAYATSAPLNVSSNIKVVAGNTDPGLNSSATAAIFFNAQMSSQQDPGSLVVAPDGTIYFRDINRGILYVKPSDGIQRLLIPTTGTSSGDGGNIASATLRSPLKIALDYQNRLLILDYTLIRRVDTNASPMTISTIIGGGASTADGVGPLATLVNPSNSVPDSNTRHYTLLPLPNGDIIFQSSNVGMYTSMQSGWKLRIYKASTNLVQSLAMSGTGYNGVAGADITTCFMGSPALMFNPLDSSLTKIMLPILTTASTACTAGGMANIDPTTMVSTAPHPAAPVVVNNTAYITSRNGEVYSFSRFNGVVKKYSVAGNNWTAVAGNGTQGYCADGTAATSCALDIYDVFVDGQSVVYIVDRGRIRVIDASGNMRTIMGQGFAYGDGGTALSARFNVVNSIDQKTNGDIVVLDSLENRFREIASGVINTIAGNGNSAVPNTSAAATSQAIISYNGYGTPSDEFTVNPTNGDVYYTRGRYYISKLSRSTGKWVDIMGGGATLYDAADGLVGTSILSTPYEAPHVLGFDGTSIMAYIGGYSTNVGYLKTYTIANGTQSHLAGSTAGSPFCADGTTTATCTIPNVTGAPVMTRSTYDAYPATPRWVMLKNNTNSLMGMQTGAGSTKITITTLATNASSFAYRHDASNHIVYYCSTTDYKIHKKDITGGTDTALTWPIASMKCTGRSLLYNSSTGNLIFPYTQNYLTGVAEYVNP